MFTSQVKSIWYWRTASSMVKELSDKQKTKGRKGPRKRGNIVAETLLRKHCFLAPQTGKHFLKKQNVSEKSQKHFLFLGSKKCFRNKCFLSAQTGKHLGKQQCFCNNVSSFCGDLKLSSPVLTTAFELHSESPLQCKNYFFTVFDKTCT